ncbi:MAG TPA: UDP-N-acetylglucosamine 2-epimerase (non-hydrolyzing) [Terriglobales bacterium]|nr:UDP-N-acetylglucosamine 2-epimerase (non-hydrolyzing) [Terriglobales bacterium]
MYCAHVVGARPNFMKAAPVMRALAQEAGVRQTLVHTGQHYDQNMSDVFFRELEIPEPDFNLAVGSGTHAVQTGQIMMRFEPVIKKDRPDLVLVYGDVNSTVAAALVCSKLGIPVAHVEAGLRSFDRSMPEEINRLLTDQIADLLFTPSEDGDQNLLREGIPAKRIYFVGNVMIDTLVRLLPKAAASLSEVMPPRYALVTLHRPSNVDEPQMLQGILRVLGEISRELPVIFPIHPRTAQRIAQLGFHPGENFLFWEPQSYLQFLALQQRATMVITDSGGIQEETTFLGVPCLTLRDSTERPVTATVGTNLLVGRDLKRLQAEVCALLSGRRKQGKIPPLWDGQAAQRIATIICKRR